MQKSILEYFSIIDQFTPEEKKLYHKVYDKPLEYKNAASIILKEAHNKSVSYEAKGELYYAKAIIEKAVKINDKFYAKSLEHLLKYSTEKDLLFDLVCSRLGFDKKTSSLEFLEDGNFILTKVI